VATSPISSRPATPSEYFSAEENTPLLASSSASPTAQSAIPTALQGLLRSRSSVRNPEQARRRLAELPLHSRDEVMDHLEGLREATDLPQTHALHIGHEAYIHLANELGARGRALPQEGEELLRQGQVLPELPAELAEIRNQFPRAAGQPEVAYARDLHAARPDLNLNDIALLAGTRQAYLRRDPAFIPFPAELAEIRNQFPRAAGQSNMAYALELHAARPDLNLNDIALLAGTRQAYLRQHPAFNL
jgi:hypothetical protein